jgi:hypothetical protein
MVNCCPDAQPSSPPCSWPWMPAAPITAANLAANFQSGLYDGARLSVSGVSVLAGQPSAPNAPASGTAAGDGSEGAFRGVGGGRRSPPPVLPLEILAAGDFEPLYRTPLDVRSGELPVLPLSIYGAGERRRAAPGSGPAGAMHASQLPARPSLAACSSASMNIQSRSAVCLLSPLPLGRCSAGLPHHACDPPAASLHAAQV